MKKFLYQFQTKKIEFETINPPCDLSIEKGDVSNRMIKEESVLLEETEISTKVEVRFAKNSKKKKKKSGIKSFFSAI
jgi:hypothetical protein